MSTDDRNPGDERTRGELAATMAAVAHDLHAHGEDREESLQAIVAAAVSTVPGTDGAGIALIEGKHITTAAPTNRTSGRLHELQVELGEGPCLQSLREQHTLVVDDLATDSRWPRLARRAGDLGVHAVLSFQLYTSGDNLGALDLYARTPGAFGADAVHVGDLFARHASVALAQAGRVHHFGRALGSRDIIGQAKGILMHRDRLTAQQAFDLLVRTSQETNLKLADVATWLVRETESRAARPEG